MKEHLEKRLRERNGNDTLQLQLEEDGQGSQDRAGCRRVHNESIEWHFKRVLITNALLESNSVFVVDL